MNFRVIPLLALILGTSAFALGIEASGFHLSPTFKLSWKESLTPKVTPIPSQHSFRLEGTHNGKPYAVWLRNQKPDAVANLSSVKRVWRQNLEATGQMGEKSRDLGCKEIGAHYYRCDGTATTTQGEFISQALFWNLKSDLTAVRVSSRSSGENAQTILEALRFSAEVAK